MQANDLQILRAQIFVIRSQQMYFSNQVFAGNGPLPTGNGGPASFVDIRSRVAMFYLGLCMQANGQAQEAEQLLLDDYKSYDDKNDAYALLLLESYVSSI